MIAAGICSNAGSEMPLVSLWLSTSIFAILSPSIVTLTFTSPPISLTPVPTYSFSASAASAFGSLAGASSKPK